MTAHNPDSRFRQGSIARAWTEASTVRGFRVEAVLSLTGLVAVLVVMSRFLAWVELRPGVVLDDPVLAFVPSRDLSWLSFGLIYLGLLSGVAVLLPHPRRLVLGMQAYAVMVLLRMLVMAVTPLDPPVGLIPLRDPLVQSVSSGEPLTRDLFFSGHTSTMFLLALLAPGRATRIFFGVCTGLIAVLVLWQHVHYTVDVLVAPLFAYLSLVLARRASTAPGS
ncbi:MAG TPA: phosphatase PAP2-related protein [Myxococcaceae bacterium]